MAVDQEFDRLFLQRMIGQHRSHPQAASAAMPPLGVGSSA